VLPISAVCNTLADDVVAQAGRSVPDNEGGTADGGLCEYKSHCDLHNFTHTGITLCLASRTHGALDVRVRGGYDHREFAIC